MSDPERALKGRLQVVIRVPDGFPLRHWVHACQFFDGDFTLCQSPAQVAVTTAAAVCDALDLGHGMLLAAE